MIITMYFRIRVDGANDTDVQTFLGRYLVYLAVHHSFPSRTDNNENPHYHIFVEADLKVDAMRNRVKRFFNILKSSDVSCKECDSERQDEYIQYLFNTKHGNVWRTVCHSGISDARISDAIARAVEVSRIYDSVHNKKSKKTITMFDIATELTELIKIKYPNVDFEDTQCNFDYYECAIGLAIELCKKYRKGMDYNMLIKLISTTTAILTPEKLARDVRDYFGRRFGM